MFAVAVVVVVAGTGKVEVRRTAVLRLTRMTLCPHSPSLVAVDKQQLHRTAAAAVDNQLVAHTVAAEERTEAAEVDCAREPDPR